MTPLTLAFIAGLGLGAVYFAALWASARRFVAGGSAAGFALGSVLRLGLAAAVLAALFALDRPLSEIAAAATGFLVARLAATRLCVRGQERG